jgi:predicted transcriptional regulator
VLRGDELREKIYEIISTRWPTYVRDVIEELGWDRENISNVTKVKYHFDQLARERRIVVKRIDRALVAWPAEIERLRVVHDFIRGI